MQVRKLLRVCKIGRGGGFKSRGDNSLLVLTDGVVATPLRLQLVMLLIWLLFFCYSLFLLFGVIAGGSVMVLLVLPHCGLSDLRSRFCDNLEVCTSLHSCSDDDESSSLCDFFSFMVVVYSGYLGITFYGSPNRCELLLLLTREPRRISCALRCTNMDGEVDEKM